MSVASRQPRFPTIASGGTWGAAARNHGGTCPKTRHPADPITGIRPLRPADAASPGTKKPECRTRLAITRGSAHDGRQPHQAQRAQHNNTDTQCPTRHNKKEDRETGIGTVPVEAKAAIKAKTVTTKTATKAETTRPDNMPDARVARDRNRSN